MKLKDIWSNVDIEVVDHDQTSIDQKIITW